MAIARCVLPVPGGTVTYCAVSALRHRSLSLAPARRPEADRQAAASPPRRESQLRVSAPRWHVDVAFRMDDVPRAMRPARVGARAPGRGRRAGRTCRALSRFVGAGIGRENRRDNSSHQGGSVRWHDDRAHTRHPSSPWSRPSPCGGKPFPARYATSYAVDSASFCCASPTPSGAQKRVAMSSEKIRSEHLQRAAFVYVRQSTLDQVRHHHESRRRQYDLAGHARSLGWVHVIVIDEDLGKSGATAAGRTGFQRLVAEVSLGHVGAVFGLEVSRLARNNRDWYQLLDLCGLLNTLLIDAEGIYDPRQLNDRLLLGLKGTMSEAELGWLRQRAHEARAAKARRGDLIMSLPVGYVQTRDGQLEKHPDRRAGSRARSRWSSRSSPNWAACARSSSGF